MAGRRCCQGSAVGRRAGPVWGGTPVERLQGKHVSGHNPQTPIPALDTIKAQKSAGRHRSGSHPTDRSKILWRRYVGQRAPHTRLAGRPPLPSPELASQAPGEDSTSTATNKRAWGAAARQCCRWAASRGSASPRSREAAAPCRRLERVEGKACQRDPSLEHEGCCRPAAPLAAPGASRRIHSTNQSPHPIPQERGRPQPFPHSPSLTQPSPRNRSVRPEPACLARSSFGGYGVVLALRGRGQEARDPSERRAVSGQPAGMGSGMGVRPALPAASAGAPSSWLRAHGRVGPGGGGGELGLRSKSWCTSEWNPSSLLSALLRRPRVCWERAAAAAALDGASSYKSGAPLR